MRQRCPNARVVGYTYLFGARLVFRGSKNGCFLTTDFQQPWCPSMVGCGVYEISDKDEQALDVYAGVPYFYQKQTMQVQCVWDVTTRREVLHLSLIHICMAKRLSISSTTPLSCGVRITRPAACSTLFMPG